MVKTIKRLISASLALTIILTTQVTLAETANKTDSTIILDGQNIAFDAYNINDNNYFKLRDLAYALNGSNSQFSVYWNEELNAISLTRGESYEPVGSELTSTDNSLAEASKTSSKILLDEKEQDFTAYNINGSNYFKLRDIGGAIGFLVGWDGEKNTVTISTETSLDSYIGSYSNNLRTDRGENPLECSGFDLKIKDIKNGYITFSFSYIGQSWSPIYFTDDITVQLNGRTCDFTWSDSWENEGIGTLHLEGGSVTLNTTVTKSAEVNRASLGTNGTDMLLHSVPEIGEQIIDPKESAATKMTNNIKYSPATKSLILKSDKTVEIKKDFGHIDFDDINKKLKEEGIEIDRIGDFCFLSADNNLYYFYTITNMGKFGRDKLEYKLWKEDIADFSSYDDNLIMLTTSGTVEVVPNKSIKTIYDDRNTFHYVKQKEYPELKNVKKVFAGEDTCFAVTDDDTLYGWGKNVNGQLGIGDKKDKESPTLISKDLNIKYITSKDGYTLAVTNDGQLYGWGRNSFYRLADFDEVLTPKKLEEISDVSHCAIEGDYSLVVKNDGTAWVLGYIAKTPFFKDNLRITKEFVKIPELSDIIYADFRYISTISMIAPNQRNQSVTITKYNAIITIDGTEYTWEEDSKNSPVKTYSNLYIHP